MRHLLAEYTPPAANDPVPALVVHKLRRDYAAQVGEDFGDTLGAHDNLTFRPVPAVWPADPANAPWIGFWRSLDVALDGRLGAAGLNDAFWDAFRADARRAGIRLSVRIGVRSAQPSRLDLLGRKRPARGFCDIGALEG